MNNQNKDVFGLIMAGGVGERFWPISRKSSPKQCLKILSNKTMIEETINRLEPLINRKNFFVVTSQQLFPSLKKLLPDVNFVIEPFARNTAACIGLGALHIEAVSPEAVMVIETADHVYSNQTAYLDHLRFAVEEARQERIVTVGIKPCRPETGFGYIHKGKLKSNVKGKKSFFVDQFVEKPNPKKAQEFVASKEFLWNSGVFVCKCRAMLKAIEKNMPQLYSGLMEIKRSRFKAETMKQVFQKLPKISIDYGVMEKEKNIVVVEGNFPWDDVGDWAAMERILPKDLDGNVVKGKSVSINSTNNIVFSKKLVALVGVKDFVVVESDDAILVCQKKDSQQLKRLTRKLSEKKEWKKYLE